ncbi:homeobox domain protein, partial [Oesophagostomum dentatum]
CAFNCAPLYGAILAVAKDTPFFLLQSLVFGRNGNLKICAIADVRVRTSDKYRMVYSDYQRLELEKEFCTSTFVTSERKAELSSLLNLTERQIKIWFQNR